MENFGEEDRISALPDDLIHRILSYGVKLDVVVQTSILSKRWVNLWSTFPYLNFKPLFSTLSDSKYRKFIAKFLINRNQQSATCSININVRSDEEFFATMVLYYAMSHGVQKFHITSADINGKFNFPVLRNLSLHKGIVAFMDLSLPCLTTLHLTNVLCRGDNLSFKGFCCLKNLTLEGYCVVCYTLEVIRIDSSSLETLTFLRGDSTYFAYCKFVVSAPKLKYFKFEGFCVPEFSTEGGLPCLEEAAFDINVNNGNSYDWDDENQVTEMIQRLMALFHEFRQTNRLTLFLETVRILSKIPDFSVYPPSPFVNLWQLNLIEYMPPFLAYENPIIPVNHFINYLISNSPGAMVFTKLLPMPVAEDDDTWDADYEATD